MDQQHRRPAGNQIDDLRFLLTPARQNLGLPGEREKEMEKGLLEGLDADLFRMECMGWSGLGITQNWG